MRVLISGNIFPDSFARNIAVTLERQGQMVLTVGESSFRLDRNGFWSKVCSTLARALPQVERPRHRALVRTVEAFQPDLILAAHGLLPVEVVREIKFNSDARIAVWYPDALANLDKQYLLASDYDAWFFKDPYMVESFRAKLGINAHYLPEACNPLWHHRVELNEAEKRMYACDLTTAGNMYYYRARMLETFKDYDLRIWGKGYPRWMNSPLRSHYPDVYAGEIEKAKAFNAAKIVLNTMHYAEITGVNCRLFEAAGCGAFQIADWKPGLFELFEPEHEIVTFHTREELKEKVDYYLAHPEERREIADRAYARAHREHTYEIRLRKMFEILGLPPETALIPEATACAVTVE
jgi:spore maturation protein CgeB